MLDCNLIRSLLKFMFLAGCSVREQAGDTFLVLTSSNLQLFHVGEGELFSCPKLQELECWVLRPN